MRIRFENSMNASHHLILDEFKAQALARRLQEQNECVAACRRPAAWLTRRSQMLELLLDMNDAARLPARHRFDLRSLAEIDSARPALATGLDPEFVQQQLHELRGHFANGLITADEYAQSVDQLHAPQPVKTTRSFASLEAKVPHTVEPPIPPIEGIDLTETAPGYLDPAHEEEYLAALDAALADPGYNPHAHHTRSLRYSQAQLPPSEKDVTIRNPDSVYNWLRKHQPQVFLQDKDVPHTENVSEKSSARTANAGGRGKRQSAVSGTPGPKVEQDEEEPGVVPESGAAGKARRGKGGGGGGGEDDGAYRPKGGNSRPAKRKREDGDAAPSKGGRKKNRAGAGTTV